MNLLDAHLQPEEQEPEKQSLWKCLRRESHWKCLVLSAIIYACISAILWCTITTLTSSSSDLSSSSPSSSYSQHQYPHHPNPYMDSSGSEGSGACARGYDYIPVAFVVMLYLVYLVECWHCHTRIELQCKVDASKVYERIRLLRECVPFVWWKAVCYHYVRRTRQVTRYRNGDAFTSTQVYYERVNSHTATSAFNISQCGLKDISRNLVNLEIHPATKIHFSKGFSFANLEAEREFEEQRSMFFHEHEHRDDYMETREGLDLVNVNFNEYMIAFADADNLPWYVSHVVFWVISALLLSWPLRVLIEYKTAYVNYHVHKLFGCNYLDNNWSSYSSSAYGGMTRVNTMESSELEYTIRNNYTIVPSYSEALLMDSGNRPPSEQQLTSSMSFHSDYVHIPGTNTYTMQGCGGFVMTNGIAHAVSGPIPMSMSSGSVCRILTNHAAVVYDTLRNKQQLQRGKRKRRRHHRRSRAENGAANSTSSTTLAGYQRGMDTPRASLPPSESCPETLEPSSSPPTHQAAAAVPQPRSAIHDHPHVHHSVVPHDAPPSYELAICDPNTSIHSLSPTNSPPYRLIETSL